MEHQDCLICKGRKATKRNSHLIPSFMVAKVCSYDGSGKRDSEVMFTMKPFEETVYAVGVPDTKIEELFDPDKLTDERINGELRNNTASKDYIFCPTCEKNLSIYLESPYAERLSKKERVVTSDLAYFFWVSIVWRMSISRQFEFALPEDTEKNLGECLNEYLDAVANGKNGVAIPEKCFMSYRLLHCSSYLPDGMAYLGGRYFDVTKVLTLTLGDIILCITFDEKALPADFEYLGLEDMIKSAPVNDGSSEEQYCEIKHHMFENAMKRMVEETALKRTFHEWDFANEIWRRIGLRGEMPEYLFVAFMEKLYCEDSKQGDRKTPERYIQLFNETLESFDYLGVD
jgi:hypothetical protein